MKSGSVFGRLPSDCMLAWQSLGGNWIPTGLLWVNKKVYLFSDKVVLGLINETNEFENFLGFGMFVKLN